MNFSEVQGRTSGGALPCRLRGEQQFIQPTVIAIPRERPAETRSRSALQVAMNARLADGTTAGDLLLPQAEIVPQTQHPSDLSHGQSLLGHSVPPPAQRRNLQPVVQRRILLLIRKLDPETSISFAVLLPRSREA